MRLALAALVYLSRGLPGRLAAPPTPGAAAVAAAVESAYVRIQPSSVETSSMDSGDGRIRSDHVKLGRGQSLPRANLEVTRAVERAGGRVLYGIESYDGRRRRQFVTLGLASGDSLVCEVKLEKRIR